MLQPTSDSTAQATVERPVYFFKTRIAGKNIKIECLNRKVAKAFTGYFADFVQPDFVVEADLATASC